MDVTATSAVLEIGGRRFRPITERTFEQDIYLATRVRAAGLDQIGEALEPGRPLEDIAFTILSRVFDSGVTFELLAGHLLEEGATWTPDHARETARFFASLTDTKAKDLLQDQLVSLVLAFFLRGAARTGISLRSFVPQENRGAAAPAGHPDSAAEAAISATSEPSSGS